MLFFKLTGKKDIGEISVLEIAVTLMIADLGVIVIEEQERSLFTALLPIFLLVLIQYIVSKLTLKSQKARDVIDGRPSLIIENGKCHQQNMRDNGYTVDDLYTQLRDKGIADISTVKYAMIEASGAFSVFDYDTPFSLPVIVDGVVQEEQLDILRVNKDWLFSQIKQRGLTVEDIFICSYTDGELYMEEKE
nr:YetF domain-containing protein [Oceanobacillus jordanicus]